MTFCQLLKKTLLSLSREYLPKGKVLQILLTSSLGSVVSKIKKHLIWTSTQGSQLNLSFPSTSIPCLKAPLDLSYFPSYHCQLLLNEMSSWFKGAAPSLFPIPLPQILKSIPLKIYPLMHHRCQISFASKVKFLVLFNKKENFWSLKTV